MNNALTLSKGESTLLTVGLISGVIYSYKRNLPTNKLLINSAIFGLCGYLIGSAVTKLYQ